MAKDIEITEYVHLGNMYVLRDGLETDHPESTYQQIIKQGGVPEDYGYEKSPSHKLRLHKGKCCPNCGFDYESIRP